MCVCLCMCVCVCCVFKKSSGRRCWWDDGALKRQLSRSRLLCPDSAQAGWDVVGVPQFPARWGLLLQLFYLLYYDLVPCLPVPPAGMTGMIWYETPGKIAASTGLSSNKLA